MIRKLVLPSILMLAARPASAADPWDVDADRGPFQVLDFETDEGTWMSVDASPDGRTIAFDLLGHIYEMPADGGTARALTEGRSWNFGPRYSPDGAHILFTSDRSGAWALWTLTRASGALRRVSDGELPVFQGTWSRDGRFVYGSQLDLMVRTSPFRFHVQTGSRQEIIASDNRPPMTHIEETPSRDRLLFEHDDQSLPGSGPRIRVYDTRTGKVESLVERPGGGASPRLSPDGRLLAYVHRDDLTAELTVRDLGTNRDRVVLRGLDRDRFESRGFYGAFPNIAWHPSGREILITQGGKLRAVALADGKIRTLPFKARVRRKLSETSRFKLTLPEGRTHTRSHRWGQRTPKGILFEALGDLWFKPEGGPPRALARTPAHETSPVANLKTGKVVHAGWTDDALGGLFETPLAGGASVRLPGAPSQYGAIAVSPDGQSIAALRGGPLLATGVRIENQTDFELILIGPDRKAAETKVTDVRWSDNRYARHPPTIRFSPDGRRLLYTEFENDVLHLRRIRTDGEDKQTLYRFPHATRVTLSPDLQWLAFREYHRSFLAPFEHVGKTLTLSAWDSIGFGKRVDPDDGDFMEFSPDGKDLVWTRGRFFHEKPLADVLAGKAGARRTDLGVEYDVARPRGTIALIGARVITMNAARDVIDSATVIIDNDRIALVGRDVAIPAGAKVFDLRGRTLMPGMFDAHGHYGSDVSALNVIEQRLYGLRANLAYGATTMYDVYGTTQKDFWVDDMLRSGAMWGARVFSVGDPMFVTTYRSKMYRPIKSLDDALEHARFNQDHGATALKDYSNHTRAGRQQLAAACRKLGLNLVSESFGDPAMDMTELIDGFTGIEHTMGLTPLYTDVVKLFGATRVGMTPTLIVLYNGTPGEKYFHQTERLWEDAKLLNFFRKDELVRLRRPTHYFDDDFAHRETGRELHKLHDAGVSLQMGAHGQMMGLGAHWEVELFVQGGFTPAEAIQIATINGFRHHGLDHALGSIEPGKLADLVVISKNPLDDIRHTRSIEMVMLNGTLYNGPDAARLWPNPTPAGKLYNLR